MDLLLNIENQINLNTYKFSKLKHIAIKCWAVNSGKNVENNEEWFKNQENRNHFKNVETFEFAGKADDWKQFENSLQIFPNLKTVATELRECPQTPRTLHLFEVCVFFFWRMFMVQQKKKEKKKKI